MLICNAVHFRTRAFEAFDGEDFVVQISRSSFCFQALSSGSIYRYLLLPLKPPSVLLRNFNLCPVLHFYMLHLLSF